MSVVDTLRGPMPQHPAGDPTADRYGRAQDELCEPVAGEDGPQHTGRGVDPIDREVVIGDETLQRVGDEIEHAPRVDVREQAFVDLE